MTTKEQDEKALTVDEKAVNAIVQNNELPDILKLQKFQAFCNKKSKKIKRDEKGKYDYIPIDVVQNDLDRLFFGQWSTENFHWERIFNELVGSIDLVVVNPISGRIIRHTGAASVVIQQKVDTPLVEFDKHKRKNALELGFPKLKAECIKNAAKELGKSFGRDLNRGLLDTYIPLISDVKDIKGENYDDVPDNMVTELHLCETKIEDAAYFNKYEKQWGGNPNFTELVKKRQAQIGN